MKRSLTFLFLFLFTFLSGTVSAKKPPPLGPFSGDQLRKLVAPIALYPDPLLTQVLQASTYPLEIVQASRLIHGENDYALIDEQDWDPSVKALAHYPDVLGMMNENLDWTQSLGQAIIAQQPDVLQSIQNLRAQAKNSGALQSTPQQRVVQMENSIEVIPVSPQTVYVPQYDSETVYSSSATDVISPLISFGLGYALGSWLNTCFDWPGSSINYGGPYYWGWDQGRRPYWNQYPTGWNNWGWNHWQPYSPGVYPPRNSAPVSHPWVGSPPSGSYPPYASSPRPPVYPTSFQPTGWKHNEGRPGPFPGGMSYPPSGFKPVGSYPNQKGSWPNSTVNSGNGQPVRNTSGGMTSPTRTFYPAKQVTTSPPPPPPPPSKVATPPPLPPSKSTGAPPSKGSPSTGTSNGNSGGFGSLRSFDTAPKGGSR